jgi:hypothetical protein
MVGVASSGIALADVTVDAKFTKHKDTNVTETIYREKAVYLKVVVNPEITKLSESLAMLNQATDDNFMIEHETLRTDTITNAVNNNTGLTILNQASGDLNNQGSSASGAANGNTGGFTYSEAQAGAEQKSSDNKLIEKDLVFYPERQLGMDMTPPPIAGKQALITNAIKNNLGVVHVNQAVGNMNNQANTLALATSFGNGGIVLTDAVLGQKQKENSVFEYNVLRTALLTDTIKANTGIISVNQTAGSLSNQANVVAIGLAVSGTAPAGGAGSP